MAGYLSVRADDSVGFAYEASYRAKAGALPATSLNCRWGLQNSFQTPP